MCYYDLDSCVDWIKTNSYKKVCLQFPENLMKISVKTSLYLKKHLPLKTYIIGDPTIENCCIDNLSAQHVNADALIHFGHACLSSSSHLPTFYIFSKETLDLDDFYKKFESYFSDKSETIILFYDVRFSHLAESIYNVLKLKYSSMILSKLNCISNVDPSNEEKNLPIVSGRIFEVSSEINYETCKAVFLGSNDKSLVSLCIGLDFKNWYHFDGDDFKKYEVYNSVYFKKRHFLLEKIKDSLTFAIIVPTVNIDKIVPITERLKWLLGKMNKKIYTISIGKLNPEKLANFPEVDIFITLTCPEIALNSYYGYFKPIVIPGEIEMAFNGARNCYDFPAIDFRQMLPGGSKYTEFEIKDTPDISLVCGKVRNYQEENSTNNETLTVSNIIDNKHLQMREWYGLNQDKVEKTIKPVEMGRDGIPINYVNEKNE